MAESEDVRQMRKLKFLNKTSSKGYIYYLYS